MKMTGLKGKLGDSVGHTPASTLLFMFLLFIIVLGAFFGLSFEFYFTGVVARAKGIYKRMGR